MRSSIPQESALARTFPSKRGPSRPVDEEEESEHDSVSVRTPSQPLHDKLDELEQRWSAKRPSREQSSKESHYVFAAGHRVLHRPSQPPAKETPSPSKAAEQKMTARKKGLVEIIGSPDQLPGIEERQSVFDRLYRQGRSSTASRRRRRPAGKDGRTFRSMPLPTTPQSSSVEGTVSTLSSSGSVFDRLYKNEKRNRVHTSRGASSRTAASGRDVYQSVSISVAASLERRLSYQVPPVRSRNRASSSGKVASVIQQHENRKAERNVEPPRSDSSRSRRTPNSPDKRSLSSAADSVFDRLYRGEKRKTPLLATKSTVRPEMTTRVQTNVSLPADSVLEHLYKGEKRKSPLTDRKKRPADSRKSAATEQLTGRIQRLPEIESSMEPDGTFSCAEENALLEDILRGGDDSDDSLLHIELPPPTVLCFAKYSGDELVDGQRPIAGMDEGKGISCDLGIKIERKTVRETLARLKLMLYVRRIQRCARAYISRAPGKGKGSTSNTVVQRTVCRPKEQDDHAAVLIQRIWRAHHSRFVTVASLLQSCLLDCSFRGPTNYNRILLLRIRMQCLSKTMADACDASMAKMQVDEHQIRIDWSKQVVVHLKRGGLSRMEPVVIALKCSIFHFSFLTCWSSQRLSAIIVKAGLLEAYKRESEELFSASVNVIQSWAHTVIVKFGLLRSRGGRVGSIGSIRTTGLRYLAQYLTPTSLQQGSAIALQNAWRFHQSQVRAADVMLISWRVKSDFETKVPDNRILGLRVGLYALFKAVGRVDCWWITEDVRVEDRLISVKWEREVGVHFTRGGVPRLESCTVGVICEACRAVFVEKWGRRKLAILIVKAALKKAIGRDRFFLMDASATLIQTWFRMKWLRLEYLRKVDASRMIQQSFRYLPRCSSDQRTLLWSQQHVTETLLEENGGLRCRGVEDISSVLAEHDRKEYAVAVIQKCARYFVLARRLQGRDRAACIVQCFVRRQRACRYAQSRKESALLIQASLRSLHQRSIERNRKSAVTVQTCWRAVSTRDSFAELRRAAIVIQTWERRRQCSSLYLSVREANMSDLKDSAASLIQSRCRRARLREQLATEIKCAAAIQCAFRRHSARSSFHTICAGIIAVQAAHRGIMARRLIFLWHTLVARSRLALLMQALWRGSRVRSEYRLLRGGAVVIQSAYRGYSTLRYFRNLREVTLALQIRHRRASCRRMHAQEEASVMLQDAWRGSRRRSKAALRRKMIVSQRNETVKNAAVVIQSRYRCCELRGDFLTLRQAAIEIQTFERRRKCFVKYQRVLVSLVCIQALWRGALTRRLEFSRMASAKLIQAVWRGSRSLKQFATLRNSVVILQSACRRRYTLKLCRKVVIRIMSLQALYRGFNVRRRLSKQLYAAVQVQAAWRGEQARHLALAMKKNRRNHQCVVNGVVVLQEAFRARRQRREAASSLIQRCYRHHVHSQRCNKLKRFVVKIQTAERRRQSLSKYSRLVRITICLQAHHRGIDDKARTSGTSPYSQWSSASHSELLEETLFTSKLSDAKTDCRPNPDNGTPSTVSNEIPVRFAWHHPSAGSSSWGPHKAVALKAYRGSSNRATMFQGIHDLAELCDIEAFRYSDPGSRTSAAVYVKVLSCFVGHCLSAGASSRNCDKARTSGTSPCSQWSSASHSELLEETLLTSKLSDAKTDCRPNPDNGTPSTVSNEIPVRFVWHHPSAGSSSWGPHKAVALKAYRGSSNRATMFQGIHDLAELCDIEAFRYSDPGSRTSAAVYVKVLSCFVGHCLSAGASSRNCDKARTSGTSPCSQWSSASHSELLEETLLTSKLYDAKTDCRPNPDNGTPSTVSNEIPVRFAWHHPSAGSSSWGPHKAVALKAYRGSSNRATMFQGIHDLAELCDIEAFRYSDPGSRTSAAVYVKVLSCFVGHCLSAGASSRSNGKE